jgi:hypothetical protein
MTRIKPICFQPILFFLKSVGEGGVDDGMKTTVGVVQVVIGVAVTKPQTV